MATNKGGKEERLPQNRKETDRGNRKKRYNSKDLNLS